MTPDVSCLLNIIQSNIKCRKCKWNKRLGCFSPCLCEKNEKNNKVTWQLELLKSCRRSATSSTAKPLVSLHKQHPATKQIGSFSSQHYINSPLPWQKHPFITMQHLYFKHNIPLLHYNSITQQHVSKVSHSVACLRKHY